MYHAVHDTRGHTMYVQLSLLTISLIAFAAFSRDAAAQDGDVFRNDVYRTEIVTVDGSQLFHVVGVAPLRVEDVRIPYRRLRFRMSAGDMYDVVLREAVLSEPVAASPFYLAQYSYGEDSVLVQQLRPYTGGVNALAMPEVRILDRRYERRGGDVELLVDVPLLTWNPANGETGWVEEYRFERVRRDGLAAAPAAEGIPPYSSMPFTGRSKNVDTAQAWIDYQNPMVKFHIDTDGMYKIDADWLQASGMNPASVDPARVQLYRKGVPVSMYAEGMGDGSIDAGDYFLFHATRNYDEGGYRYVPDDLMDSRYPEYMSIYTDSTAYWLHFNTGGPLRTSDDPGMSPLPADTLDWAYELAHIESDGWRGDVGISTVLAQVPDFNGYESWFWQWLWLYQGTRGFAFNADHVKHGEVAHGWAKVLSWYGTNVGGANHAATIKINEGETIDSVTFFREEQALLHGTTVSDSIREGRNTIFLSTHNIGDPESLMIYDWFDVEYPRVLRVGSIQRLFHFDSAMGTGERLIRFIEVPDAAPRLLRVLDDGRAVLLPVASFSVDNGYTVHFADSLLAGAQYFLSTESQLRVPAIGEAIQIEVLTGQSQEAGYVIISADELLEPSREYAQYIATEYGITTRVVDVHDIYDNYSFGMFQPEAIKLFLFDSYFGTVTDSLRYVLLIGDANYYYKTSTLPYSRNVVPSYGSPVSDPWFVSFDPKAIELSVSIGRLPVASTEQLQRYLSHHQAFRSQRIDDWNRKSIHFSGGLDPGEHARFRMINEAIITDFVNPAPFAGEYAHFYKTENPTTDFGPVSPEDFNAVLDDGGIFISYIGHSGTQTWDNSIASPRQLLNERNRHPLITDFGCSTARFAEPDILCFAELFLIEEESQAIGYIGNSAAGFDQTLQMMPGLFYGNLMEEGLLVVGDAHRVAKRALSDLFPSSLVADISIQTNSLIGDPIVSMPFPGKPNPVIRSEWIRSADDIITDQMDSLHFEIVVANHGLYPQDSVSVQFEALTGGDVWHSSRRMIPLPKYADTLAYSIASNKTAGSSLVRISLDTENRVDEIYEDDNVAVTGYEVLSTSVRIANEILGRSRMGSSAMPLINPVYSPGDVDKVIFEFDTDPAFASPTTIDASYGKTITPLADPPVQAAEKLYWKARIDGAEEYAGPFVRWNGSVEADFVQRDSSEFESDARSRIRINQESVSLFSGDRTISAESSSFPRSFTAVRIDGINVLPATFFRGFGLVVLDSISMDVKYVGAFHALDEYLGKMDSLKKILDEIQFGEVVVMTTADEPRAGMDSVMQVRVKSLGSAYADSVARFYRCAWTMIGRKGAATGTVLEKFTRNGVVIVDTAVFVPPDTGWIQSPMIGPATAWDRVVLDRSAVTASTINLQVWGEDTLGARSILLEPGNVDQASLGGIDAARYPYIQLRAELIPGAAPGPEIRHWAVLFDQLPELAINYQSILVLEDSVQQGDLQEVEIGIINPGESDSGPFPVLVEVTGEDNIPKPVAEFTVVNVATNTWFDSTISVSTDFLRGAHALTVRVDRDNMVQEQYEDNNTYIASFFVKPDTSRPDLDVTFDGYTPLDGDYIRYNPEIVVELHSNSPYPIPSIEHFTVTLDGLELDLDSIDHDFTPSTKDAPARLRFQPVLEDGIYYFGFNGMDGKDIMVYEEPREIRVRVSTENRIAELYNYPNPTEGETAFTFLLTGVEPPQEVEVKVYTVAGRLIRKLSYPASSMRIGYNALKWDGRDEDGDEIANGVYFYKIIANFPDTSFEEIGRMVVMR